MDVKKSSLPLIGRRSIRLRRANTVKTIAQENLGYVHDNPSPSPAGGPTGGLASPLNSRLINRRHASAQCSLLALAADMIESTRGGGRGGGADYPPSPTSGLFCRATGLVSPPLAAAGVRVRISPPPETPSAPAVAIQPQPVKGILVSIEGGGGGEVGAGGGVDSPRRTALKDALTLPGQHQRRKAITFLDPEEETLLNQAYDKRVVCDHKRASYDSSWERLSSLSPCDLGMRSDTLVSPRMSPVLHRRKSPPPLTVSASLDQKPGYKKDRHWLNVPARPRTTGSRKSGRKREVRPVEGAYSASDESDIEPEPASPPSQRRGRRQAIFDSKSLVLEDDHSPFNSNDESDTGSVSSAGGGGGGGSGVGGGVGGVGGEGCVGTSTSIVPPPKPPPRRKQSSVGLSMNYPGDLLSQARPRRTVPPVLKRNTIADFANTKAYQASTASLISASADQDKKVKNAFSILKLGSHWLDLIANKDGEKQPTPELKNYERKRREAVWELFQSECIFLIDHLMALKHCFMEPLKRVQVEGYLVFAEPADLFGNLDELCYVSYTFCSDFISILLKNATIKDFARTDVLIQGLKRFCQLTRNGEVYHDYCLNYAKAMTYLEQLRKNDDFCEFEKFCEQDARCHRLQLTDLLISPMQHCTKVPLLLNSVRRYTEDPYEQQMLIEALEKLEKSLKILETKMLWLKNFERVQEIQQQIIWLPITELEPRAYIPEFLRSSLTRQPCERILASPKRQLLYEGAVTMLEVSKVVDMYMFLFDDILLITKVKKPPRKKANPVDGSPYVSHKVRTDGAIFVVYRQPIALDRFTIHDVRPSDVAANGLKNAFVLVQISRFKQVIGVATLQAATESLKVVWLSRLQAAQDKYKEAVRRAELGHTSIDEITVDLMTQVTSPSEKLRTEGEDDDDIDDFIVPPPHQQLHLSLSMRRERRRSSQPREPSVDLSSSGGSGSSSVERSNGGRRRTSVGAGRDQPDLPYATEGQEARQGRIQSSCRSLQMPTAQLPGGGRGVVTSRGGTADDVQRERSKSIQSLSCPSLQPTEFASLGLDCPSSPSSELRAFLTVPSTHQLKRHSLI